MTLHERLDPAVATPRPASFHDLMAGLGYMLFQWSMVERSLDDEIADAAPRGRRLRRAQPARAHGERAAWRVARAARPRAAARCRRSMPRSTGSASSVQDFQRLRNLVANGLASAEMEGAEPVIRCTLGPTRHGAPDEVRLAMGDLLAAIDAMEQTRAEMALLRGHGGH